MTKKKVVSIVAVIFIVMSSAIIYWLYFSRPDFFPKNEHALIERINETFPKAKAKTIQDTIYVDERHVFVPYISHEGEHGKSFWIWDKRKWKVAYIHTTGRPRLWKVNRNDPSTYHLVWNIHPDDQISEITYYLIRKRGYHISNGKHYYFPRVQMGKTVSLDEKTYGAMKLPDPWISFVTSYKEVEEAKQSNSLFNDFSLERHMYFGWISYDQHGKQKFPNHSVNGDGYLNEKVNLEYLMLVNEEDID